MKKVLLIPLLLLSSYLSGCKKEKDYIFKETTIAVFADNQLHSNTPKYTGYLKNHLKLCKANNVDVIMIAGDLVNNAMSYQYTMFEEALKETYGEDESKYPEFVYTMGNHEWYSADERQDDNAVFLFNKHARINTKNLVKRTSSKTATSDSSIYGNYYKVINGIPFIGISGESASGILGYTLRDEIKSWLKEISNLSSVKAGGPIFVAHHYAFPDVTYSFGQGSTVYSSILYDLIKEYPQIILFSGDTHYSGVNERTINQVDFTDINLGSSSYSRHVSRSVAMDKDSVFENIQKNSSGKDVMTGPVANGYDNTPHIHFVKIDERGNTTINRFFSTPDPTAPTHLGLEWTIPVNSNKENFIYTSKRYENKEWANLMYKKDGLNWDNDSELSFQYSAGNLTLTFPDVIDYNYCEHYRISVTSTDEVTKMYDFISNYYKYDQTPHLNEFTIENVGLESIKKVEVHAYDFFDNVSINHLEK